MEWARKKKKDKGPRRAEKPPSPFVQKSVALFHRLRLAMAHKTSFTLLIGDEGTILLHLKGDQVLSREFAPDASEGNLEALRETIIRDRQAPITMIIDSVDQSFVQQTLPPVSSLSVQRLIKRRLERDFKKEDIKGAILLGKDKTGRKDWNFLMISVEKSPQLSVWLEFVMSFENRFRGILLLPVESATFVKSLEKASGVTAKGGSDAEWKILVSHNKVGGFRQIILRHGRLIFTRLALPVGDSTPQVVAGNIEQEMVSTIEYLKRFGYSAMNGLDVYIIAAKEVCELIDSTRFEARTFNVFSPHEVAMRLAIKNATQPEDQFGDVVLSSAISMARKKILHLGTVETRLYDQYHLIKHAQRLGGTFSLLGLLVYGSMTGYAVLLAQGAFEDAEQKRRTSQQTLDSVKRAIETGKLDVEVVGNQVELYQLVQSQKRSPRHFFTLLPEAVQSPVLIRSIRWRLGDGLNPGQVVPNFSTFNYAGGDASEKPPGSSAPSGPETSGSPAPPSPASAAADPALVAADKIMTAVLTLEFPEGLKSHALFKKFSDDFLNDMHQKLPDYTIVYTNIPQEYIAARGFKLNFDESAVEATLGDKPVVIEITVRGPVMVPTASAEKKTP